jgi:hypothetical protein
MFLPQSSVCEGSSLQQKYYHSEPWLEMVYAVHVSSQAVSTAQCWYRPTPRPSIWPFLSRFIYLKFTRILLLPCASLVGHPAGSVWTCLPRILLPCTPHSTLHRHSHVRSGIKRRTDVIRRVYHVRYDIKTNKRTKVYASILYTLYTCYMFRLLTLPSAGRCITKNMYIMAILISAPWGTQILHINYSLYFK